MVTLLINISEQPDNLMQVQRLAKADGVPTPRERALTECLLIAMTRATGDFSESQGGSPVQKTVHIPLEQILELAPSP